MVDALVWLIYERFCTGLVNTTKSSGTIVSRKIYYLSTEFSRHCCRACSSSPSSRTIRTQLSANREVYLAVIVTKSSDSSSSSPKEDAIAMHIPNHVQARVHTLSLLLPLLALSTRCTAGRNTLERGMLVFGDMLEQLRPARKRRIAGRARMRCSGWF